MNMTKKKYTLGLTKSLSNKLERIEKTTDMKINSFGFIKTGGENLVIEVNEEWIFRFPKEHISKENEKERLSGCNSILSAASF